MQQTVFFSAVFFCIFGAGFVHSCDPMAKCNNKDIFLNANGTGVVSIYDFAAGSTICNLPVQTKPQLPYQVGCSNIGTPIPITLYVGTASHCEAKVNVWDKIPPSIVCPQSVQAEAQDKCGAYVTFPKPQVKDNCAGTIKVEQVAGPAPGSLFPVGTTNVYFKATDGQGNFNGCYFQVTVVDKRPPSILCPSNIEIASAATQCGAVVSWNAPTVKDNCQVVSVTQKVGPAPGSFFPVSSAPVQIAYLATDQAGNSNYCSFNVKVKDTTPPQIKCPDDIHMDSLPKICGNYAQFSKPLAVDNCPGVVNVKEVAGGGPFFHVGTTAVYFQAIDAAGNSNGCRFQVAISNTNSANCSNTANTDITVNTSQKKRDGSRVDEDELNSEIADFLDIKEDKVRTVFSDTSDDEVFVHISISSSHAQKYIQQLETAIQNQDSNLPETLQSANLVSLPDDNDLDLVLSGELSGELSFTAEDTFSSATTVTYSLLGIMTVLLVIVF